jgi:hypothetical protein
LIALLALLVVDGAALANTGRPKSVRAGARAGKAGKDAHLDAGQKAFDEGSFLTALDELKASVAAQPTARAWLLLGNTYLQLGQLDEARKAWNETLRLEKSRPRRQIVGSLIESLASMPKAKIRIDSSPPGATVFLDLKAAGARGTTPVELTVVPGRHKVFFALDGYDDAVATPDPIANEGQTVLVDAALRKRGCDVALSARQKGVLAALDGGEQILLPTTVRVTPGGHDVVLSGQGLAPRAVAFTCTDLRPIRLDESLSSTPAGLIHVHAQAGYNIYVDGVSISVDEARGFPVTPGPHDVQVEAPGNPPWHAQVIVRAGEQTDVTPRFTSRGMGITGVEVVPIPEAARVWLDGKPLSLGVMTATQPGPHTIEARALGHRGFSRKLLLQPGEITRIEARLVKFTQAPLAVGITFALLAAGGEATAIAAFVKAGREVQDSPGFKQWRTVEIAGHAAAGACAAVALTGLILDGLQRRSGLEPDAGKDRTGAVPRVTAGPLDGGRGGAVALSGTLP